MVVKDTAVSLRAKQSNLAVKDIKVTMYWDVKYVKPLSNYRIYVELIDGRNGIFDVKPYLNRGVFRELKDVDYFNQVGVLFGAITWPHEQDIAPETLVTEMIPAESPC